MNEEAKELMDKVVDYTSMDKEIILEKTQKYSAIAASSFCAGIILSIFDFSGKYSNITDILFGTALILIIAIWLLCSGKAAEMKKDKKKTKRYLIILLAMLTFSTFLLVAMLGL